MLSRTKASQDINGDKAVSEEAGKGDLPPAIDGASSTNSAVRQAPGPIEPAPAPGPDDSELDAVIASGRPLNLHEAIGLAFRLQPRLRSQLESIAQARASADRGLALPADRRGGRERGRV